MPAETGSTWYWLSRRFSLLTNHYRFTNFVTLTILMMMSDFRLYSWESMQSFQNILRHIYGAFYFYFFFYFSFFLVVNLERLSGVLSLKERYMVDIYSAQ